MKFEIMDNKKFTFWNRLTATMMLVISAVVYLLTIEPTASFWDCGEFIASSYKLEVGHPPGNPVFQLIARFFSMFADPEHAAVAVNAMNAICSALTIFFLYLTTVFLAKRLIRPSEDGTYSIAKAIAIFGSGAVGALAYTFSDIRIRCCWSACIYFQRYILVLGGGGRGLCHVIPCHRPGILGYDKVV